MNFFVNYDTTTGIIDSYQEGGDQVGNCPLNCATLQFAAVVPQLWDNKFEVQMKVDITTKQLIFINPVVIPQPINS